MQTREYYLEKNGCVVYITKMIKTRYDWIVMCNAIRPDGLFRAEHQINEDEFLDHEPVKISRKEAEERIAQYLSVQNRTTMKTLGLF
jgi:hypothetical protein